MQKLVRVLIIYTAIITTLLLINTLLSIRSSAEQNKKAEAIFDSLKQNLEKITAYQQSQKEIVQRLEDLSQNKSANADTKVLGESKQASDSSKILSDFVTINDKKWETVDVYESNSYQAKVIGKLEFNKVYSFVKKSDSWYQIKLPASQRGEPNSQNLGWVAGRFLKEIANNGPASPAGGHQE